MVFKNCYWIPTAIGISKRKASGRWIALQPPGEGLEYTSVHGE